MFSTKRIVSALAFVAVVLALLALMPRGAAVNAQQSGSQIVGAWYGDVSLPGMGGFPFMAKFNADGTWVADDARGFGLLPNFPQQGTTFIGAWSRTGARTYSFRSFQIDHGPLPAFGLPESYQVLRIEGKVSVTPGDFNHLSGISQVMIFPCPADATNAFGFSCPDPMAVPFEPVATFDFTLSRILPPA